MDSGFGVQALRNLRGILKHFRIRSVFEQLFVRGLSLHREDLDAEDLKTT